MKFTDGFYGEANMYPEFDETSYAEYQDLIEEISREEAQLRQEEID